MKDFANITDAIQYHKRCYICGSTLIPTVSAREPFHIINNPDTEQPELEIDLTRNIDSEDDDLLYINLWTNKVRIKTMRRQHSRMIYNPEDGMMHNVSSNQPAFIKGLQNIPKTYGNTIYEPIDINCANYLCGKFYYVIQMIIDATKMRVEHLYLNSEQITWQDDQGDHTIHNIFSIGKTEYWRHTTAIDQNITIPLISINLQNPSETVARIKKLSTYS